MDLTEAIEVFIILYGYDGAIEELERLHDRVAKNAGSGMDDEDLLNAVLILEQFLIMKKIIERLRDEKQAERSGSPFPALKKSEVIDS